MHALLRYARENANGLSYLASYDLSFLACYARYTRIYEEFI
nr:hypothetical protein PIFADJLK_00076 [Oryctes rhinoceros nudivirus]